MSTNMAVGEECQHVELDENDIYGTKLMKDVDLLIKVEAIRQLKCSERRNLSDLSLSLERAKNKQALNALCNFVPLLPHRWLIQPSSKLEFDKVQSSSSRLQRIHVYIKYDWDKKLREEPKRRVSKHKRK